jgi:predicted RNA binding protein YcfA (HicA-like mRNA interferase family)
MFRNISFRQLQAILLKLGFEKVPTRGQHLVYIHRDTGTRIILPPSRLKSVPPVYVRAVGKELDDHGIMTSEEFFHLVAEKEL